MSLSGRSSLSAKPSVSQEAPYRNDTPLPFATSLSAPTYAGAEGSPRYQRCKSSQRMSLLVMR